MQAWNEDIKNNKRGNHSTRICIRRGNFWLYCNEVSKVRNCSRGRPKGSLFNSYYAEVYTRALLLSLDCFTLPLIRTLYYWVLNKEVSSTILKVFGITQPGIEPRSPGPLTNTLPTRPICRMKRVDIDLLFSTSRVWHKVSLFKRIPVGVNSHIFLPVCFTNDM